MIEDVGHLRAVSCTHSGVFRTAGVRRGALEFVVEDRVSFILCSETRPCPHVPTKSQVAMEGSGGGPCVGVSRARLWPDQPDQEARKAAIELLCEILDSDRAAGDEELALVRIRPDQEW